LRKRIEIEDVVISAERLYRDVKWEPKYSLKEGLAKTKEIIEGERI
jgi:nucleoside-diphosphate-sugar epimerase